MPKVKIKERQGQNRCPYCMDDLDGELHECSCGATYHQACVKELKTCAILGCERSLKERKQTRRAGPFTPFLRSGTGPLYVRSVAAQAKTVAKVVGVFLVVFFLIWAGMQTPKRQRAGTQHRPVHRPGEIPAGLEARRDIVVERLLALVERQGAMVRLEQQFDQSKDPEVLQRWNALQSAYRQELSSVLRSCDNGPLAGGPAGFKKHVRRQVMEKVPAVDAQRGLRVLNDFFGAPGW